MDDIQQQIDDMNQRLDDNDSSLSDFSDNLDSSINDIQSTLDDNASSIETLNESSGQLTYPLTQDTIDLIKEIYPTGFVTLVGGTITLTDPRISTTSVIILTCVTPIGTQGLLSYAASSGQAIISSKTTPAGGDNSIINYVIMN